MTILEFEAKASPSFAPTSNSRTISKSHGQNFAVPNGTSKIRTTKQTLLVQQKQDYKPTTWVSTTLVQN